MYDTYYKFSSDPFRITPNGGNHFSFSTFAKARSYVSYALQRAEGILMVTGDPGLGKTTLIRNCIANAPEELVVIELDGTNLNSDDLLIRLGNRLSLDCNDCSSAQILIMLEGNLKGLARSNTRAVLLIDEAQDLTMSAMSTVKTLANLELDGVPLLQLFLIGQKTLSSYLKTPELEPIFQRLTVACELEPMTETEVRGYIVHNLKSVGWTDTPLIHSSVVSIVFQFSLGVPRTVNLICSRLLLRGMLEKLRQISKDDAMSVVNELIAEGLLSNYKDGVPRVDISA